MSACNAIALLWVFSPFSLKEIGRKACLPQPLGKFDFLFKAVLWQTIDYQSSKVGLSTGPVQGFDSWRLWGRLTLKGLSHEISHVLQEGIAFTNGLLGGRTGTLTLNRPSSSPSSTHESRVTLSKSLIH